MQRGQETAQVVGQATSDGLDAAYVQPQPFFYTLPVSTQVGFWQLCYLIDVEGTVAESNELNNSGCLPLTVTGPSLGTGFGELGPQNHVDTYFSGGSNSALYELRDVTRTAQYATLPSHWHGGRMPRGEAIITRSASTGAVLADADNIWNAPGQQSGVDAHVNTGKTYDYLRSWPKIPVKAEEV